ncbi:MAG: UDP-N-acetylmuramoyl-L-alanyl-D-glutamate--2,6-diaminopimelate ligase [Alphaproteobacteria bacterium]|nr:UDP-N-acetylmuramoyl-L-alanyl-D-glutamate--2,6-diaminopimelate ligase [Alphaproteobacteria bacterium]
MRLSSLIASNEGIRYDGPDLDITGLTQDSRKAKPGSLFIATPGTKLDGRAFVDDAIKNGASAILAPEGFSCAAPTLLTHDMRRATAAFAAAFYPRQPETIVAVTGTSGKTSTAQFAREIWQALGHQSASIGTLGLVTAEGTSYGSLTTPDAITLHHLLDDCAEQGITHAALEASSHGIELHRLDKVRLKAGGFTNLSRDHLDYHQTMEAYFKAKLRLFEELLPVRAAAVLNADSDMFPVLRDTAQKRGLEIIAYGKEGADLRLIEAQPDARGQILKLEVFGRKHEVLLPVIGGFQAWNALCAAGLAIGSGADSDAVIGALGKVSGVPGRMQFIGTSAKGGAVFVDYAHKPDALDNVLQAMRPHVAAQKAKLGVIFGCGGNRDAGKRPIMGEIAARLADFTIVTDDNPRNEDAATIRAAVLAGCRDKANVTEIGDRARAIAAGIEKLGAGDVLIIAGKGHEPGQTVGDRVLPFDDAEEARKVLGL